MRLGKHDEPPVAEKRRAASLFVGGMALGYLLGSRHGHDGRSRHAGRTFRRAGARAAGRSKGFVHGLRPGGHEPVDDVELAHKVESIVFRDQRFPKGRISVNAERGEVFLRGEVDEPEVIGALGVAVWKVPGVRGVRNLLHLPGTPAPAHR
jgi:hypothetical protein